MRTSTTSFSIGLLVLAMASPVTAAPATCAPESNGWVPGQYYGTGARVFSEGNWYESRERNEGHRPGTGEFSWRKLDSAPTCSSPDKSEFAEDTSNDARSKHSKPANPTSAPTTPDRDSSTAITDRITNPESESEPAAGHNPEKNCEPAQTWTFAGSYRVGQRVTHKGNVYEAIRPTDGDMPGVAQPPHWKQTDKNCHSGTK